MRIVIVHYAEPIPCDSGFVLSRYAALARSLCRRGHQVARIAPTFLHRTREQRSCDRRLEHEEFGHFVLIPTPGYKNSRSFARLRFLKSFEVGAAAAVSRLDPELLLIGMPQPGIAARCRKLLGGKVRIVLDIRDLWPDAQIGTSRGLERLAIMTLSHMIRKRVVTDLDASDAVVSLSEPYLKWAKNLNPRANGLRAGVFPLGAVHAGPTQPAGGRSGVIFVGSLSASFDFDSFLSGWDLFEKEAPSLAARNPLVIAGQGERGDLIRRRIRNLSHARHVGHVPHATALQMMTESRIAVAPYAPGYPSNLPNKLFEYAGAGLPVIASLGGYAGSLIGEKGVGVSAGQTDARWWSSQLRAILSDDNALKDMGGKTQEWARENSRGVVAERMATFLEECAESR